jgi:predicted dehydrogenase
MDKPVRIGIIGCGDVMTAYMYHAQILGGQGLVEVTYACDRREERESIMRQRYHVPTFTTDPAILLASEQVDAVLVLTSMPEHGRLAIQALQAGKHVLVEKPMAVTLEEAQALVEASQNSQGLLVCAPFVTLSPTYRTILARVQRGDIGRVISARARYGHAGPTWGSWYYQNGGAIFDLAPYNLASLTGLLGPARRVLAMTGTAIPDRIVDGAATLSKVEDNAHILIDFGDAIFAVVTTGFTMQQYRCPALELYGSSGTLQMMGDDWDPEGYELFQNSAGAWQIYKETDPGWLWTDGLRHLVECIQNGQKPLVTPEQAYHVLEIMVKAKLSGRDGQEKMIESSFSALNIDAPLEGEQVHLVHDRTHQRGAATE